MTKGVPFCPAFTPSPNGEPLRGAIAKTRRERVRSFETRDARLPASPSITEVPKMTLMQRIRGTTRKALLSLVAPSPRVLNFECLPGCPSAAPAANVTLEPDQQAPQCTPSRSSSSSSSPDNTDQVVPSVIRCTCRAEEWQEGGYSSSQMLESAAELASCIAQLFSRFVDPKAQTVDYAALAHSTAFARYLQSARKLRYFDPTLLSAPERKALFLNIYNALMIHANAVLRRPRSTYERHRLYGSASYNIGGRLYSLDQIEHGVLRGNRPGGGPIRQQCFEPGDARLQCALPEPLDPRIHFALNCGARSCPPVRYYDPYKVDDALDAATRAFLLDVELDVETRTVRLSRILQWYGTDFGETPTAILTWLLPFLDDEKRQILQTLLDEQKDDGRPLKLEYTNYDWSVNDSAVL